MALNQITVANPATVSSADASTVTALSGKAGDTIVSALHGKWYTYNYRGAVFTYNVTGVTLPVNAATLASKFAVYNPPGSGKNMELICFDYGSVLATTVVDSVLLVYTTGTPAQASTFTTPGTALSGIVGATASNTCIPYSALTHVGTPVKLAVLGYWGGITSTAGTVCHYDFDGRVVVPPGTVVSVCMATAASTASGFDGGLTWAEVPV